MLFEEVLEGLLVLTSKPHFGQYTRTHAECGYEGGS